MKFREREKLHQQETKEIIKREDDKKDLLKWQIVRLKWNNQELRKKEQGLEQSKSILEENCNKLRQERDTAIKRAQELQNQKELVSSHFICPVLQVVLFASEKEKKKDRQVFLGCTLQMSNLETKFRESEKLHQQETKEIIKREDDKKDLLRWQIVRLKWNNQELRKKEQELEQSKSILEENCNRLRQEWDTAINRAQELQNQKEFVLSHFICPVLQGNLETKLREREKLHQQETKEIIKREDYKNDLLRWQIVRLKWNNQELRKKEPELEQSKSTPQESYNRLRQERDNAIKRVQELQNQKKLVPSHFCWKM